MNSLLLAIKANDIEEIQRLLTFSPSCGKLVNYQSPENNETPLFVACVRGYSGVVRWLHGRGARVEATTTWGATALHAAAERGHETIVRFLIENKAPLQVQTQYGDTALHLAAFRGHHRVVLVLLAAGIDSSITNSKGRTAMDEAEVAGHKIICKHLGYEKLSKSKKTSHHLSGPSAFAIMQTELLCKPVNTPAHSEGLSHNRPGNSQTAKNDWRGINAIDCNPHTTNAMRAQSRILNTMCSTHQKTAPAATPVSSVCRQSNNGVSDEYDTFPSKNCAEPAVKPHPCYTGKQKRTLLRDIGKSQSCEVMSSSDLSSGKGVAITSTTGTNEKFHGHSRCRRINSVERAVEELQHDLRATRQQMELAQRDLLDVKDMMRLCWARNGCAVNERATQNRQRFVISPCDDVTDPFESD
ncbi:uncharacterized protein [Diadema setosum]|uniref:uncharacterized protein n=1 Tax=Diadema setosum TaxID=31175 RepID=UPI003B3B3BDA